jgi:soluble lytic murein transglycosylase
MKNFMNSIVLVTVFATVLICKQSTPANASISPLLRPKLNSGRVRIMQTTEIIDSEFTASMSQNSYSDAEIKAFIISKTKSSLPIQFQPRSKKISETIISQANLYNMDPLLILALIENESRFNPKALGRFGEQGLMQIKPSTARWIAQKYKLSWSKKYSLYNPIHNIKFGVAYLDYLRNKFHKSGRIYVEAYNMGPQRMYEHLKNHEDIQTYLKAIQQHYLAIYEQVEVSTQARNERIAKAKFFARFRAKIRQILSA